LVWVDIGVFMTAALGLGANADGSKLVNNHATLSIQPEILVAGQLGIGKVVVQVLLGHDVNREWDQVTWPRTKSL
jgi:hypothetical protein